MMKSFIRFGIFLILAAIFILPTTSVAASPSHLQLNDVIGDQYFAFGGAAGWEVNNLWNTRQMARIGQEFMPTLPVLNVVYLFPYTCKDCAPQWMMVVIHKDSIFGPVIGVSLPIQLKYASGNDVIYTRFPFPLVVHLQPGARYVIEALRLTGSGSSILFWNDPEMDGYPRGRAIVQSAPAGWADLWFDERYVVGTPKIALDCFFNGWQYLLRPNGSTFNNQSECVRFVTSKG